MTTIACVFESKKINEDTALYYFVKPITGEISDEYFIDENGNKYSILDEKTADNSDFPKQVCFFIKLLDDLKENGESIESVISNYGDAYQNNICFVKKSNGSNKIVALNVEGLFNSITDDVSQEDIESNSCEDISQYNHTIKEFLGYLLALKTTSFSIEDKETINQILKYIYAIIEDIMVEFDTSISAQYLEGIDQNNELATKELDEETEQTEYRITNIKSLSDEIKKSLKGQDQAIRRVLAELARKERSKGANKKAILLTGNTGVGKTFLIELLAKATKNPITIVDSTQLTVPGYVGKDIEQVLWEVYENCGKDIDKAQKSIIYFDEIDKKGSEHKSDVSGQGVLNSLLKFIDGTTYIAAKNSRSSETVNFNTSDMIIILGGAFADVHNKINKQIGFGIENSAVSERISDFSGKGELPKELAGRIDIVNLAPLTRDTLQDILENSDASPLKIQEEVFKNCGTRITFTSEFINGVVSYALNAGQGARGLPGIIDNATHEALCQCIDDGDCDEVIIGKECLTDPKGYCFVKKRKN